MGVPVPLSDSEIETALSKLPGWEGDGSGLRKALHFDTFGEAMKFMADCVPGIEKQDHHPVWTNKYNSVTILLTTFDAGNKTTALDVELAFYLDDVARRCNARE